ncbi:MAG: hypothetical protein U0U67_07165 [Chitinophagales bacterium]
MKNAILVLFLFIGLAAFSKPKMVHSVADFEKLYNDKTYPFNKLSDTTFQRLKSTIQFDEIGNFRGFSYVSGLWKELTYEEYLVFNYLILGIKDGIRQEDKTDYETRRNR